MTFGVSEPRVDKLAGSYLATSCVRSTSVDLTRNDTNPPTSIPDSQSRHHTRALNFEVPESTTCFEARALTPHKGFS